MTVTCRDASLNDIPAIDHIFRHSFCDTFAHLYRDEDLQAFLAEFTPAAWAQEVGSADYSFRVAQSAGDAVGYAKLGPSSLPVQQVAPTIELRQLYILKPWRGSGIAAALMDWALAEARRRGACEMLLTVFTDNLRARRFYERYGFEEVGPYAFMVGEHADEDIIMRLRL